MTNIEDSLKRLDKLTQEEARMATAQVLKVAHTIDEGVRGVADKVVGVDDRVASVNERVAGVDRRVEGVDGRVAGVDNKLEAVSDRVTIVDDRVGDVGDRVGTVDNKIAVVIEGVQLFSVNHQMGYSILIYQTEKKQGSSCSKQPMT